MTSTQARLLPPSHPPAQAEQPTRVLRAPLPPVLDDSHDGRALALLPPRARGISPDTDALPPE